MTLNFVKYQGTGNDFVLIDNRTGAWQAYLAIQVPQQFATEKDLVAHLCHRKFGVGADGLMLLQNKEGFDFEMVYFNSDGGLSSMCGNGGRCIAAWAFSLGLGDDTLRFWAPDGTHEARKTNDGKGIALNMNPVSQVQQINTNDWELNTGSPHYVSFQDNNIQQLALVDWAKNIRYNEPYTNLGINVNAVNILDENKISMRTYERGVEDETLSCGTGVCAAAISFVHRSGMALNPAESGQPQTEATGNQVQNHLIEVITPGGVLQVSLQRHHNNYNNIVLIGPATFVFQGQL
jgi:diaminopimelate epimerase